FGITRQAYYQHSWEAENLQTADLLILKEVMAIRKQHRVMGTRKLYDMLQPFMIEHGIKMGRDALFDLLAANRLLVKKRKRKIQTTCSNHWLRKYPNLIRNFIPKAINQLWVSDITYWKISTGEHLYISLITDAYSRKIVGYHVAETMEAIQSIAALQMALAALDGAAVPLQLTHHSDRGIQYCSGKYVKLLQDNDIRISMTENGDPLENAIAERVNGIIKEEYLNYYQTNNLPQAKQQLQKAINLYNNGRPHMSISNLTPNKLHNHQKINPLRLWKNYFKKLNNFENKIEHDPVNLSQDLSINL
ncbi:MAG: IS3 family transposase, partial [Ginsengibacter sp.]